MGFLEFPGNDFDLAFRFKDDAFGFVWYRISGFRVLHMRQCTGGGVWGG